MCIVFTQVCVFVLNSPPAAKVIGKQAHSSKSHQRDWKSPGLNLGHWVQGEWLIHYITTVPYTVFAFIVPPKSFAA